MGLIKKDRLISAGDLFVDREQPTHYFKRHLIEIKNAGIGDSGMLLLYSGSGGIGKTTLLKKFVSMIQAEAPNTKFVRYNFDGGNNAVDMVVALKKMRETLSKKYRIEFPLFDKGCICFAQKIGDYNSAEHLKKVLRDSSVLYDFKKHLNSLSSGTDTAHTVAKAANELIDSAIDVADELFDMSMITKVSKVFMNFLDMRISRQEEEARANGNSDYAIVFAELNRYDNEDDPDYIRELLPALFATDLSYWLNKHKTSLIIFLDAYEKLKSEEKQLENVRLISTGNDVARDWWIEELLTADHVMWVIAGRYKLDRIGAIELKKLGDRCA